MLVSRSPAALVCLVLLPCAGCATTAGAQEQLRPAVNAYNQFVRWKKFDQAASFRAVEDQAAFLARYIAAEDDLNVESIEIRAVNWSPTEEIDGADITVVIHAYLLPSTIVEKIIMQQRWEYLEGRWVLVRADRELVPPLDDSSGAAVDPPQRGAPVDDGLSGGG